MRDWRFWDWIGYGSIAVPAVFWMLPSDVRGAPMLAFMHAFPWRFVPFALVALGTVVLVVRSRLRSGALPSPKARDTGAAGIFASGVEDLKISGSKIKGYPRGIDVTDSKRVEIKDSENIK